MYLNSKYVLVIPGAKVNIPPKFSHFENEVLGLWLFNEFPITEQEQFNTVNWETK